ncbi:MAG: hypothetical protein HQK49_05275 [Oligoflexia bacterium]|nr:hypothetical protein [Oligoflexia bacterium]
MTDIKDLVKIIEVGAKILNVDYDSKVSTKDILIKDFSISGHNKNPGEIDSEKIDKEIKGYEILKATFEQFLKLNKKDVKKDVDDAKEILSINDSIRNLETMIIRKKSEKIPAFSCNKMEELNARYKQEAKTDFSDLSNNCYMGNASNIGTLRTLAGNLAITVDIQQSFKESIIRYNSNPKNKSDQKDISNFPRKYYEFYKDNKENKFLDEVSDLIENKDSIYVNIPTEDGAILRSIYLEPLKSKRINKTVIIGHGNAMLPEESIGLAQKYLRLGYNVLLARSRGMYGHSRDLSSAILKDKNTKYQRWNSTPDTLAKDYKAISKFVGGKSRLLHGFSIGSFGISSTIKEDPGREDDYIIEHGDASLHEIAKNQAKGILRPILGKPINLLMGNALNTKDRLKELSIQNSKKSGKKSNVFIIHSKKDELMGYQGVKKNLKNLGLSEDKILEEEKLGTQEYTSNSGGKVFLNVHKRGTSHSSRNENLLDSKEFKKFLETGMTNSNNQELFEKNWDSRK